MAFQRNVYIQSISDQQILPIFNKTMYFRKKNHVFKKYQTREKVHTSYVHMQFMISFEIIKIFSLKKDMMDWKLDFIFAFLFLTVIVKGLITTKEKIYICYSKNFLQLQSRFFHKKYFVFIFCSIIKIINTNLL